MSIGIKVYRKATCESSFAWAASGIESEPDGVVYLADRIEHCQGRQGRSWKVLDGQLLITILLKPGRLVSLCQTINYEQQLAFLGMALALGVLGPLRRYGALLKWPNDFMIEGKKLGGMLTKVHWKESSLQAVICGIGLNINTPISLDQDLAARATSIMDVQGEVIDKEALFAEILASLDERYNEWKLQDCAKLYHEWRGAQGILGKEVSVHDTSKKYVHGIVRDFRQNGDLVLAQGNLTMNLSFHETFDVLI